MNKYFNYTDVLGYGWRVMGRNIGFFIGLGFLYFGIVVVLSIPEMILQHMKNKEPSLIVAMVLVMILRCIVQTVLVIGIFKIALSFCDGVKPSIGKLFDGFDCFWRFIGTWFLYSLIVLGGVLLLIVPGVIWSIKFGKCWYFVIDKGMGPVEALKASSRITSGVKWDLLGFSIMCMLINYLGILCLVIGIFATYPMILVAGALVYRQLAAQTALLETV